MDYRLHIQSVSGNERGARQMKIIKTLLVISACMVCYFIGTAQAKPVTETIKPDILNYIECDSVETFDVQGSELHIIANDGNEYVFTK